MVIITWFAFAAVIGTVCYWLGRASRLNHAIKHEPERVLYNPDTGEVLEPGTPEWERAMRDGKVRTFV